MYHTFGTDPNSNRIIRKKEANWYPHIGGFVQVPQYIDCTKWNTCYKINLKLYL